MEQTDTPHSEEVRQVETRLYNRMWRNAVAGFVKSAAIGAVIGLAVGLATTALGLPLFGEGASLLTGALKGGMWLAGVIGGFGAVAGIQSTRDTRRWFLKHENPELKSQTQAAARAPEVMPSLEAAIDRDDCGCNHAAALAEQKAKETRNHIPGM